MLIRMFNADALPAISAVAVKDLSEHHLRTMVEGV